MNRVTAMASAMLVILILGLWCSRESEKRMKDTVEKAMEKMEKMEREIETARWRTITEDVLATVYNAKPSQCNRDCLHTASMCRIRKDRIPQMRIIAMERTMMKEFGLSYGNVVKIEGAGHYDGLWRIEDTMNRRFAGQHKIDILVPDNVRKGKWHGVRVSVPANELAEKECSDFLERAKLSI